MRVLGIETSCDETAAAVYDAERGLLAHALHSQTALHAPHGGIVPELASRDHVRRLLPMIREVLARAETGPGNIDAVAYTAGPGLIGALLVGVAVGRSLAWSWGVAAVPVHHMEAHLLAPMLEPDPPEFPFLALLVSGGHTQLVRVDALGAYRLLGETLDDAVGEAFDKTAKLLDLGYPGGPEVARLALSGRPGVFAFPRPMTDRPGLDFSFSGLKTAVATAIAGSAVRDDDQARADVALAFEEAVVETLTIKCRRALESTRLRRLVVAGGVGANRRLRTVLAEVAAGLGTTVHYPRPEFCTDNAAMVAYAGYRHLAAGVSPAPLGFSAHPRWGLGGQ